VAILNRTKTPKAPRVIRPRVYLSKEESKSINALQPKERKICFGLAAWAAIYMTFFHFNPPKGAEVAPIWKLFVLYGAVAAFVAAAYKTNRLVASLGGLLCVYIPVVEGTAQSSGYFLPSVPLLALMMWLSFKISGDRRKLTEEKAASGDFGIDPRTRAEQNRKAKKPGTTTATEDATGRALAPASKRYTPPKAKKK
jgi:hypothetical protein